MEPRILSGNESERSNQQLKRKWMADAFVIYIGCSINLNDRIKLLIQQLSLSVAIDNIFMVTFSSLEVVKKFDIQAISVMQN